MKIKYTILSKPETVNYKMELKEFKTRSKSPLKHRNRKRESRNTISGGWEDISGKLGNEK